jgi:hypothetical protein
MTDLPPGVLTGDSGQTYLIGDLIGATEPAGPCDAAEFGGSPTINAVTGECRCLVCARCGHHTGNAHQGHYWMFCKVLAARLRAELAPGEQLGAGEFMRRASRDEFHMCCPEPDGCELEPKEAPGA